LKGKMIERDQKLDRQREYTRQHTLSPEQLKKLFEDKIARAVKYSQVGQKQRQLCEELS
jgi:hypothetical protein